MTNEERIVKMGLDIIADGKRNDHCTSDPIFVVQKRNRIYGIDLQYDPQIEWQHSDENFALDETQSKIAEDFYNNHLDVPAYIARGKAYDISWNDAEEKPDDYVSDLKRIGYVDTWEFVQPFFTLQAAEDYIRSDAHRLTDPRIYVDSGYRNIEWQSAREAFVLAARIISACEKKAVLA